MATEFDQERDLSISRVIKAPRSVVWGCWSVPELFEQWWIPAPAQVKALSFDLYPGGAFVTEFSEDGTTFGPHINGCFLVVDEQRRIVFTDALGQDWRPNAESFLTADFTFADHEEGTLYTATARHASADVRAHHEELGFYEGWNAVTDQLAALAESQASK